MWPSAEHEDLGSAHAFSTDSAAFTISPRHVLCPAGQQVHLHRETLHRELCPLEHCGQPFQAGLGLGISIGSLAISRCEIQWLPVEQRGQVGGEETHLRAFFLYNHFVFSWALCLLMGTAGQIICIPGYVLELWDELQQEQDHNQFLALRLFLVFCYWCKSTELHRSQQCCFRGRKQGWPHAIAWGWWLTQIDELLVKIALSDSALNLFRPTSWTEVEIEPE